MDKKTEKTATTDGVRRAGEVFKITGIPGYHVELETGEVVTCDSMGRRKSITHNGECGVIAQQSVQRKLRMLGRLRLALHLQGEKTDLVDSAITQEMAIVEKTKIRIFSDVRNNCIARLDNFPKAVDTGLRIMKSVLKDNPELGDLIK